jgi:threonine aldolase
MMNFRSDNEAGAHPLIIEALGRAFTSGSASSFGEDEWTQRAERRLREVFKPDLVAFPVVTGTVANALSLACCTPPWGAVYCHPTAHIGVDEANALQFYTSGAKLCPLDGQAGKIDPKNLVGDPRQTVRAPPRRAIDRVDEVADPPGDRAQFPDWPLSERGLRAGSRSVGACMQRQIPC